MSLNQDPGGEVSQVPSSPANRFFHITNAYWVRVKGRMKFSRDECYGLCYIIKNNNITMLF